jgi:hypothetical protein
MHPAPAQILYSTNRQRSSPTQNCEQHSTSLSHTFSRRPHFVKHTQQIPGKISSLCERQRPPSTSQHELSRDGISHTKALDWQIGPESSIDILSSGRNNSA